MSERLTIIVDGGCHGKNPAPSVYWSVARRASDSAPWTVERFTSANHHTNQEAELLALRDGLRQAYGVRDWRSLTIWSDSKCAVHWVNGTWGCYAEHLIPLRDDCAKLLLGMRQAGRDITIAWHGRKASVEVLGH